MNQTVTPPDGSWQVLIDAAPRDVAAQVWQDENTLELQTVPGALPLVGVSLRYLAAGTGLISIHSKQVQPFGPVAVPVL